MVNSKVVVELCPPTVESFGTATRYQQHNSTCILVLIGSYFDSNDYKMHAWGMITESMEDVSISLIKKSDSLPWPVPLHWHWYHAGTKPPLSRQQLAGSNCHRCRCSTVYSPPTAHRHHTAHWPNRGASSTCAVIQRNNILNHRYYS